MKTIVITETEYIDLLHYKELYNEIENEWRIYSLELENIVIVELEDLREDEE